MNIKPCMGHISGTWELLSCEYWRKSMIIGEKNTDLKRLTGRLKLRFLTEIGRLHWNQGEEVAHFAWFGEPWNTLTAIVNTCIQWSPWDKKLDKTIDHLFKIGWSFLIPIRNDLHITVTEMYFIGKHDGHFVILLCFCNNLQIRS